jgi:hypothetical protein
LVCLATKSILLYGDNFIVAFTFASLGSSDSSSGSAKADQRGFQSLIRVPSLR